MERLELWFSTGRTLPRKHWERQEERGVTLWFSQRKVLAGWPVPGSGWREACPLVAGISIEFSRITTTYPVTELLLAVEDFK